LSIERLQGSAYGDDNLAGNGGNNVILGEAGADTLNGRGGSDALRGGLGADILTGGAGNDVFEFTAVNQRGDTINDFSSSVVGNNDSLRFLASEFGGGLIAGQALAANQFQASSASTAATASVRFIYDTDDGILRYDANGSAAGGLLTIATLSGAATLTAADFVFI
jgi:Ca2+-binding RTX toxin-like protein